VSRAVTHSLFVYKNVRHCLLIPHVTPSLLPTRAHLNTNPKYLPPTPLHTVMAFTTAASPTLLDIIYRWFQLLHKPKQDLVAQHYRVLAEEQQRGVTMAGASDLQSLRPYARTAEEERSPPYPLGGPSMSASVEEFIREARMVGGGGVVS
jgi:hypothetical protein